MIKARQILICALISLPVINCAGLTEPTLNTPQSDKASIVKRHTMIELRDLHVVKQQLDYSCGAAAMATIMKNYFGEKTSEKEILDLLKIHLKNFTKEEIAKKKKNGFSLLDLKSVANRKGYQAAGFRLTFEQLRQLAAPVIVFVKPLGYHHFAVLRGIEGDRVFLADPSRGNLRMSDTRFLEEYGGIVFVLGKDGEELINTYNLALSRTDDYVQPDRHRLISGTTDFRSNTANWVQRSRPLRPQLP